MTDSAFCPRCGTARSANLRYCAKCAYDFGEDKGYAIVSGTRPDASGWSYTAPAAAAPPKQPRTGIERLLVAAIAIVVLGVGGYVFLNSYAGGLTNPVSSRAPQLGKVVFGASYNDSTLAIIGEQTQFPLSTKVIAWSATLKEPAGATKLTLVFARVSSGGAETIIDTAEVPISNPSFSVLANSGDLVSIVDRTAGTYVMRYLRGATILAEGRFTLA